MQLKIEGMGRNTNPLCGILCAAGIAVLALAVTPAEARLLSDKDRALYTKAFEAMEKGKPEQALKHGKKAKAELPRKVLAWMTYTQEIGKPSFAEIAQFLDQSPQWPRLTPIRRFAEAVMPKDLPTQEVLLWFEKRPPVSAEGLLRYAEALEEVGRTAEATILIRQAWTRHVLTERQEFALFDRYEKILQERDQINRLDRLLWTRRGAPARRQARRIGYDHLALAEARLLTGLRRKGAKAAVKKVPDGLRDDPGLIYERARSHRRKRDYENVVALLDPPRPEAPYPKTWWPLRRWAVREAIEQGDYQVAYRIASGHGFDSGVGFAEGEWLAGWIALRFLDQSKQAYQHFTVLFQKVTTPVSRSRGAFWAAEAAEAKGDPKWVRHWRRIAANFSATYYGQLAAERLGQTTLTVNLPDASLPTEADHRRFHKQELVKVIRLLGELEQAKLQKTFLLHLSRQAETEADFALTADLATEQERPDLALRVAKRARNKGIILSDRLYPTPQIPISEELDPRLVYALIRQESGFYTDAKSRVGASGLMQLMPATAKRVARRLKMSYKRSRLTEDPEYNLRLGQHYIRSMLDRYKGSYVLALAAYNAGPKRVDQWLKRNGDPRNPQVDKITWVEKIPFPETRNYVQRIMEAIPVYNTQLASQNLATHTDWIDAPIKDTF